MIFDKLTNNILKEYSIKKSYKSIILEQEENADQKKENEETQTNQNEEQSTKKDDTDKKQQQKKVPEINTLDDNEEQEDEIEQIESDSINDKEQDFLQKFIRYTELIYLNNDTKYIIQDFKNVLGDNMETAYNIINNNKADRQQQIANLSKELNDLRQSIQEQAKQAQVKVSLLSLLEKKEEEEDSSFQPVLDDET